MKSIERSRFILLSCLALAIYFLAGNVPNLAQEKAAAGIKITILYDNYALSEGTKADWGFACLIEGTEKTILFDTGTKGEIFWNNADKLGVDITKVEAIVISHLHGDHIGALLTVLQKKKGLPVYIPGSDPAPIVEQAALAGGRLEKVKNAMEICPNVHLSGEMGWPIKEISLLISTEKDVLLVTGCAHPGIVEIVRRANEISGRKVNFIMGGFHLYEDSEARIGSIITSLKEQGVEKCGPTHCTGDRAIGLFKEAFGARFIPLGVGKVITLNEGETIRYPSY